MLLAGLIVLAFGLSPFALQAVGFDYSSPEGNPLSKFHPATYFAIVLVFLVAVTSRAPIGWIEQLARRHPRLMLYFLAVFLVAAHASILRQPVTRILETFFPAGLVFILLRSPSPDRIRVLALVLNTLMCANAALGLFEFVSGTRLTPFVVLGEEATYDWRSTALLGHPLSNALLTSCYIVALAVQGCFLGPVPRAVAMLLNLAAMVAFGGRAATALALLTLGVLAAARMIRIARGARFNPNILILALLSTPIFALGVLAFSQTKLFLKFLYRFEDDAGSAQARSVMFELFDRIPLGEFLFAPKKELVETWVNILGLEHGIESFWVAFVVYYGFVATVVLLLGICMFVAELLTQCGRRAAWVLAVFFIVASTSTGISSKTGLLTQVTILLLVFFSQSGQRQPKAAIPAM